MENNTRSASAVPTNGAGGERPWSRDDIAARLVTLEPGDRSELERIAAALREHASRENAAVKGLLEEAASKCMSAAAGSPAAARDLAAAGKLVQLAAPGPRPAEVATKAPVASGAVATPADVSVVAEAPKPAKSAGAVHEPDYEAAARQITIPAETERDMVECFVVEAKELLQGAEAAMLALEDRPGDQPSVDTVFRAFHTVKGVTAMLGLAVIADFAHRAENLLSRVRDKEIRFEGGYSTLALRSLDALNALVDGVGRTAAGEKAFPPDDMPELLRALTDPEAAGYGSGGVRPASAAPKAAKQEAAAQSIAPQSIATQSIAPPPTIAVAESPASVASVASSESNEKEQPLHGDEHDAGQSHAAGGGGGGDSARGDKGGSVADNSVRVRMDRLDRLVDMVGELVIAQSMVAQDETMRASGRHDMLKKVAHAGKIVRELQDLSMSLRMVPLKAAFQKTARVVRDTARKVGKKVVFDCAGEDVELDRNMVDLISDPLVHMVRNSVDHGIEQPEARRAAGKSETGCVRLEAFYSGGNVVVRLSDDGNGLDRARIVKKALEKGLIRSEHGLSESDVFNLIFMPGFSTNDNVTDLSGRGVGMDVVRRAVDSLKGRIDIASTPGRGSTFSLHLPLTLAITDGMLVRVGDQRYLIPTVNMHQSFRPTADMLATVRGKGELVLLRGQPMPMFRLHRIFNVHGARTNPTEALIVVVEGPEGRAALLVDELLEQRQVVAKSLGDGLPQIRGISGGAVLGDGTVGLILDPTGLLEMAATEEELPTALAAV